MPEVDPSGDLSFVILQETRSKPYLYLLNGTHFFIYIWEMINVKGNKSTYIWGINIFQRIISIDI